MSDPLRDMLEAIDQSINKTFLERCKYEEPASAYRAALMSHEHARDRVMKLLVDRESLKLPVIVLPAGHSLP